MFVGIPTSRTIPGMRASLNPAAFTLTAYVPAGSDGTVKLPLFPVVVSKVVPLPLFCTATAAFGTRAPVESATTPDKLDVELICACKAAHNKRVVIEMNPRAFMMPLPRSELGIAYSRLQAVARAKRKLQDFASPVEYVSGMRPQPLIAVSD